MLLTSQTWVSFSRWNSQGDVISFWVVVIHLGFPNNIPLMPHKPPSGSWWLCWCCHCTTSHDEQPACSYRSHSTRWSCLPTLVHPLSVCVAHPSMAHTPQLFFFYRPCVSLFALSCAFCFNFCLDTPQITICSCICQYICTHCLSSTLLKQCFIWWKHKHQQQAYIHDSY